MSTRSGSSGPRGLQPLRSRLISVIVLKEDESTFPDLNVAEVFDCVDHVLPHVLPNVRYFAGLVHYSDCELLLECLSKTQRGLILATLQNTHVWRNERAIVKGVIPSADKVRFYEGVMSGIVEGLRVYEPLEGHLVVEHVTIERSGAHVFGLFEEREDVLEGIPYDREG